MIIDDEEDILDVLTKGLSKDGYQVHGFTDPLAAVKHIESGCQDCDLAICDVRMPRMSGFELAREVRRINPRVKIIMMTAFEVNKIEFDRMFPSTTIESVIRKPFSPSKLVMLVNEVYKHKAE